MGLTKEIENMEGFFETKRTNTNANTTKMDTMYFSKDDDIYGFETNRSKSTMNLVILFPILINSCQGSRLKFIETSPKFLNTEKQKQSMFDKKQKFWDTNIFLAILITCLTLQWDSL
jgi:hypothetical protein